MVVILFTATFLVGSGVHAVVYTWYYFAPSGSSFNLHNIMLMLYVFPCIVYAILSIVLLPYHFVTLVLKKQKERSFDWLWGIEILVTIWLLLIPLLSGAVAFTVLWRDCATTVDAPCHDDPISERIIIAQMSNGWILVGAGVAHAIAWSLLYTAINKREMEK